ncbi:type III-B CRISPR module RAMP protein Cmr6 [Aquifex aeolicus]|uniref:CRISPR type III-associated protein domain-containing protein n=1 Tax=Aquifex aeolicus (strain VF5) TaxID=224324 RepID=O66701_AQUAE|nr:type III-B CRISPR module RAMP protein Cmr6 [Aquifex aeolicus]AAC06661.1 putative protein [Aquifex aeolicus VF5]
MANTIVVGELIFGTGYFSTGKLEVGKEKGKETDNKKNFIHKALKKVDFLEEFESLNLLLNKYIPIPCGDIVTIKNNNEKLWLKDGTINEELKKIFLEEIIKDDNFGKLKEKLKNFSEILKRKNREIAQSLLNQGYVNVFNEDEFLKLKTAERLIVGLGTTHVFETGLALHHLFGIPYIPSSSLKGIVRMAHFWEIVEENIKNIKEDKKDDVIKRLQEKLQKGDIRKEQNKEFLIHMLLFGTQKFKGLLTFLDAYPMIDESNKNKIFDLDLINVHYKSYYTQNKPPGDWENPNPVYFLTVSKGIEFHFWVLFDSYRAEKLKKYNDFENVINELLDNNYENLRNKLKELLEDTLTLYGVGAKTRLDYGIFDGGNK